MISYVSGLKREFHHIRNAHGESNEYEPAMVILHPAKPGKSFIIPQDSIWKYVDPLDNLDAEPTDLKDFMRIVGRALRDKDIGKRVPGELGDRIKDQAQRDMIACQFASALWNTNKILTCTGYNLFKMMEMFDLDPSPQTAAQLLLFIQDGLDELKNMPPAPPEEDQVAGEVAIWQGGQKIVSKDLMVKESDLVIEEGEA